MRATREIKTDAKVFVKMIWSYFQKHKRSMPWRDKISPYGVVVSEVMLQQTQVMRVLEKYPQFIKAFPSFEDLARASLSEVLLVWQGMGYNRRAKYLREIASVVTSTYQGIIPDNPKILEKLPGIGPATASSIVVFIYNKPELFIETNIRRVYIHHFFKDKEKVSDDEIMPQLAKTIDRNNPRDWYYALMDYGSYLAKQRENPNRKSRHYTRQSGFEGADRQIRGQILKILLKQHKLTRVELAAHLSFEKKRIYAMLKELEDEGFLSKQQGLYFIKS